MSITYGRVENGRVVEQKILGKNGWSAPEGEAWLPIEVETPEYSRLTHQEVRREDHIESDRIVRRRVIEPIAVTPDMVRAECQRRILELTGSTDVLGSLIKQINNPGRYDEAIALLRTKSNLLEANGDIPIDFRSDDYWS